MNNTSSQNQSVVMRRKMGNSANGSMPPYNPSLGKAFSSSANRFGLGNVVDEYYTGDAKPIVPSADKSGFLPQPHLEDKYNFIDYTDIRAGDFQGLIPSFQSANLPVLIGAALIYVGAGAPGYKPVIRQAKRIIQKPEKYVRTASMASGLAVLIAYGQLYR
ncbi:hypothetical protein N9N26_01080 [Candidatus Poseidoniales archaeon]|jgi:hypothetical protein|nr:hypothetical protein [Candidatus Poseidoniales archaeon]